VRSILESAGVILCQTNAAAARLAVAMSQQHTTQQHGQHGMEAEA
jgi:hypothetical protein